MYMERHQGQLPKTRDEKLYQRILARKTEKNLEKQEKREKEQEAREKELRDEVKNLRLAASQQQTSPPAKPDTTGNCSLVIRVPSLRLKMGKSGTHLRVGESSLFSP